MPGNVSHTEDRDCLMDKLPEWLKVEVVDEESKERFKECWISIARLPPRLETHRMAVFVSQVISRAEVRSSFEDSGLYRVRTGQEWQPSQVLDAFELKRRTVNGNPVTATEWVFKFRAEDVFREIKGGLGRKQEVAVGRKAQGVSLSEETDKTKGGELGLAVNQVTRQLPPPSGRDPPPWPHADHGGPYPGGPSPVPRPQRKNWRAGFQYGYHSNTAPPAPTSSSFATPDPWPPLDNSPSGPIRGGMPRSQPPAYWERPYSQAPGRGSGYSYDPQAGSFGHSPRPQFSGDRASQSGQGYSAVRKSEYTPHQPPGYSSYWDSPAYAPDAQYSAAYGSSGKGHFSGQAPISGKGYPPGKGQPSGTGHPPVKGQPSWQDQPSWKGQTSGKGQPFGKGKGKGKGKQKGKDTLSEVSTGSLRMGMSPPLRLMMLWRESPQIAQVQPQLSLKWLIGQDLRDMILMVLDMWFLMFTVSMTRVMGTVMPSFATSRPLTLIGKGAGTMTQTHGSTVIRTTASPLLMEPPNTEGAVRCIEVASVGSFPSLSVTVLVIPRVYLSPPTHLHRSPIISPF